MALTRTGTAEGFTDPDGASVTAMTQVDATGKPGLQFSTSGGDTSLTTTYAKVAVKEMAMIGATAPNAFTLNLAKHLLIKVESLSGVATIQVKITVDSTGNECIFESAATAPITGEDLATKGSLNFNLGTGNPGVTQAAEWYIWAKTNAGTASMNQATLFWNSIT